MIPVWLYNEDGDPLICVFVTVPMPKIITIANKIFVWNPSRRQYVLNENFMAQSSDTVREVEEVPEMYTP